MTEPNGLFAPHVTANHEGYNRHNTIVACRQVGGRHVVFVNDWEACRDWLAQGGIPAHRVKTDQYNDDDADAHFDAAVYVNHVDFELNVAESALPVEYHKRGVVYLGNELGTGTASRTDAWGEKGINRATELGRKVVFGNWAYKNIPPALPKTIAALRRNGGWMGFHEGTYAGKPLAPDAFADGAIGGFIAWKQQHGIPCWITEFAGSLTAHDGWKPLYKDDWKLWAAQIEWALANVYAPHNAPVSEFTLNKWDLGRGFEFIDVPDFLDELARLNRSYAYMTEPIPVPPPTEGGELASLSKLPGVFINVRAQPNLASATSNPSADVGDLALNDVVKWFPNAKQGEWVYIEPVNAPKANAGWVSLQYGAVAFTPVPQPVVKGRYLAPEAEARIRAYSKAIDDANAAIMAELDAAPEVAPPDPAIPF